jgi:hypothetical protein
VDFIVENTDLIRVKRRKFGTHNCITVYEADVETVGDFNFSFYDRTPRSNTIYEYAVTNVFGSAEGSYTINKIKTSFEGLILTEKDRYFPAMLETRLNEQRQNKPTSVVPVIGRKYPYVIANGLVNYKSGNISAIFVRLDESKCEWDFDDSWEYREEVNAFLYDGLPKLIKNYDGRMWLASVSGSEIQESMWNNNEAVVATSFDWTEVGNCDDGHDLYEAGLVNAAQ